MTEIISGLPLLDTALFNQLKALSAASIPTEKGLQGRKLLGCLFPYMEALGVVVQISLQFPESCSPLSRPRGGGEMFLRVRRANLICIIGTP